MRAKKIEEAIKHMPGFSREAIDAAVKTRKEKEKSNKDGVWRVYSGVDAFVFPNERVSEENRIYLPYIDVIAKSAESAREEVAKMFNMSLEDQDSNYDYANYISDHVEFQRYF